MKSKCSLLSVQTQLISLSEFPLRAAPWLTETLCITSPHQAAPIPLMGGGISLIMGKSIPCPIRLLIQYVDLS